MPERIFVTKYDFILVPEFNGYTNILVPIPKENANDSDDDREAYALNFLEGAVINTFPMYFETTKTLLQLNVPEFHELGYMESYMLAYNDLLRTGDIDEVTVVAATFTLDWKKEYVENLALFSDKVIKETQEILADIAYRTEQQ